MRAVLLSEQAGRVAASLNAFRSAEFRTICEHLGEFLEPFQRARLVTAATFYGVEGLRYFDRYFPYLLYMEVVSDADTEAEAILVHLMLAA